MSQQRRLFVYLYKVASFSGITPFYDFRNGKLSRHRLCKIYGIILTLLVTMVLFPIVHLIQYNTKNKLIVFLINCTMCSSCLAAGTMTFCSVAKTEKWEKMLHLMRYAESVVLLKTDTQSPRNKTICIVMFGFMSLTSLSYNVYEIWIELASRDFLRMPIFYLRYVMVIFVFLAIEVIDNIYKRFQDLNKYIKLCLLNTTISQITHDGMILIDISKIRRNYRILNELVECYNKLFGLTILTFTLNMLFHILNSMNVFIFEWKNCSLGLDMIIRSFAPTIWICVSF